MTEAEKVDELLTRADLMVSTESCSNVEWKALTRETTDVIRALREKIIATKGEV